MRVRGKNEFEPWDTKHATEKTCASLPRVTQTLLILRLIFISTAYISLRVYRLHSRILWEAYSVSQYPPNLNTMDSTLDPSQQFDFTAAAPWFESSASPRAHCVPYLPDDLWDLGMNGCDAVAPYAGRLRDTLIGAERDFENVSAYRPQKISLYCCINTFNVGES